MQGWLVVNSFLHSPKFGELYKFFQDSANKLNIRLQVKTTDSLLCAVDDNFTEYDLPDFVIFWDKDIYLAQRLGKAGIPLYNSAKSIELCDNKILTALALANKVAMPATIIAPKTFDGVGYNNDAFIRRATEVLGFPVIVKEAYGSFGQQVYLARTLDEVKKIIKKINYKDCLFQQYIAQSSGRDIRINVVGGKVVAAMLRYNDNDFRSNITNGGKMQAVTPTKEQAEIAIRACRILGLDFAGVDVLFGKDGKPYVCEVNSNVHFKSTYDCTGIDMSELILRYIVEDLKK